MANREKKYITPKQDKAKENNTTKELKSDRLISICSYQIWGEDKQNDISSIFSPLNTSFYGFYFRNFFATETMYRVNQKKGGGV